jgi:hypothetical protein
MGSVPAPLFLCQGRALAAVEAAQAPFGICPPLLRVDPTPMGRVRRSPLLVGQKRRDPRQWGRAGLNALLVGRTSRGPPLLGQTRP